MPPAPKPHPALEKAAIEHKEVLAREQHVETMGAAEFGHFTVA